MKPHINHIKLLRDRRKIMLIRCFVINTATTRISHLEPAQQH